MRNHYPTLTLSLALSCAVLAVPSRANAQTATLPTGPVTLEQVLAVAEAQSESIAGAEAGVRRAEGDYVRARSGRYPQLSGSASYDRALASEFSGVFDSGGATPCAPFTLTAAAPLDARLTEIERALDCGAIGSSLFGGGSGGADGEDTQLPFGRENTWRASLSFSQAVYTGGRLRAQSEIAAIGRDSAELTLTSTRAQLLFDVTQAYYDAALSDRLVSIASATIGQADATVRQVQAGFDAGAQPEFEVLRARVARDNQTPALIRQRVNRDLALLRLKQLLELPADYDLRLAASLDDPALAPPAAFAPRLATAAATLKQHDAGVIGEVPNANDRTAIREIGAAVRLREAALAAARAERLPSVSINSTYSQVSYPGSFFPVSDFRNNWTVGATMQVPILTGGRLRGDQLVAQAELEQTRTQLKQVEELAALDTRSAWAELLAAQAQWEATSGTIQQAARAYEIAEVRYRSGVSTQLELSDARLLLQQSDANRAQAARDLQVARARIALLPDLPLSTGGAGNRPQPQQQPFAIPPSPALPQAPVDGGRQRNAAAQAPARQGERQ